MDKIAKVTIDHVGIINRNISASEGVFRPLGFVCGSASKMETGLKNEREVTNMHFMFDNSYIECITSSPGDYLSVYLHSEAALHTVVLTSSDIETSYKRLKENGIVCSQIMTASRPADHGEKKGTAVFGWIKLLEPPIPHTLLGIAEHKTPDLIFQPTRYVHKNAVNKVIQLVCCTEEKSAYTYLNGMENISSALGEKTENGCCISQLRMMTPDAIKAKFGVVSDCSRSHYGGLKLLTTDLPAVERMVKKSSLSWHICSEGLVVDVSAQIGLFLCFTE